MQAKRSILCVDDNSDMREFFKFWFGHHGQEIVLAASCQEALRYIHNDSFDLILIDCLLPDGDGIGLCKQIRVFYPHTPIIFHSGDARTSVREEAIAAGANVFIEKPVELELLEETVKNLLKPHSSR